MLLHVMLTLIGSVLAGLLAWVVRILLRIDTSIEILHDHVSDDLATLATRVDMSNSYADSISSTLDKFYIDFLARFDDDLVRKLNTVLSIGQKTDGLKPMVNQETGEIELKAVDEGW